MYSKYTALSPNIRSHSASNGDDSPHSCTELIRISKCGISGRVSEDKVMFWWWLGQESPGLQGHGMANIKIPRSSGSSS